LNQSSSSLSSFILINNSQSIYRTFKFSKLRGSGSSHLLFPLVIHPKYDCSYDFTSVSSPISPKG
jgi:hypothetical protein